MNIPRVITLPVGQLRSNCYIYHTSPTEALVVDPGDDSDFVNQKLLDLELTPQAILITHGHFDHVMGAFGVQSAFNCPVYIHQDDDFLLQRMRETAIHFTEVDPGPPPLITHYFSTEESITIGDLQVTLIKTPGHTPGSLSFYDSKNHVVFIGDIFFADGSTGGVDHSYSDKNTLRNSIIKISELPDDTMVYPGHGSSLSIRQYKNVLTF